MHLNARIIAVPQNDEVPMSDSLDVVRQRSSWRAHLGSPREIFSIAVGLVGCIGIWWVAARVAPGVDPALAWPEALLLAAGLLAAVVGLIAALERFGWIAAGNTAMQVAATANDRIINVIVKLRRRAVSLRRQAVLSLVITLIALSAGLYLFYFAEEISDRSSADLLAALRHTSLSASTALDRAQSDAERERIGAEEFITLQGLTPKERNAAVMTAHVASATDAVKTAATEIRQSLDSIEKHLLSLTTGDRTRQMISAIATRVGAILLIVFLVQILVSLYRYNTRSAAYYDARADALELSLDEQGILQLERLELLSSIITPERIDFGREPKSPTEAGLEFAKVLMTSRNERAPAERASREPGA